MTIYITIVSTIGVIIALLVYFREKPRVVVNISRNHTITPEPISFNFSIYNQTKQVISIDNYGFQFKFKGKSMSKLNDKFYSIKEAGRVMVKPGDTANLVWRYDDTTLGKANVKSLEIFKVKWGIVVTLDNKYHRVKLPKNVAVFLNSLIKEQ